MFANEIIINCCCLFYFYTFGSGGSNYLEKQKFRVEVDQVSTLNIYLPMRGKFYFRHLYFKSIRKEMFSKVTFLSFYVEETTKSYWKEWVIKKFIFSKFTDSRAATLLNINPPKYKCFFQALLVQVQNSNITEVATYYLSRNMWLYQQMTCKKICKIVVATDSQNLFHEMLTFQQFYFQLVILREWKQEIKIKQVATNKCFAIFLLWKFDQKPWKMPANNFIFSKITGCRYPLMASNFSNVFHFSTKQILNRI